MMSAWIEDYQESTEEDRIEVVRSVMSRMIEARRRRVDPEVRRRMKRLRQKARAKRKQKGRKKKPIRKEKGRLILDVSPFTFNKSPEAKKRITNPVTRNKVKIRSLSGHPDMRAYRLYQRYYQKWKKKWKKKFEKIQNSRQKKKRSLSRKENEKGRGKRGILESHLIRYAYENPESRSWVLPLLDEDRDV